MTAVICPVTLHVQALACGLHYWTIAATKDFHFTDKTQQMTIDVNDVLHILWRIGLAHTPSTKDAFTKAKGRET